MARVDGLELTTDFEQLQRPNSLHNRQKIESDTEKSNCYSGCGFENLIFSSNVQFLFVVILTCFVQIRVFL
jgi:hypothetical protein